MRSFNKYDWVIVTVGFLSVIGGIALAVSWPYIYKHVLNSNLVLTTKSKSYDSWIETPLPMYLDIYLFNWTNADEFRKNPTIKPQLKEIGPFVFREVHDRVNVTWNVDGSVSYNQTRNWTFIPELSLNLKTPVTNLDVIALGTAHATRYSPLHVVVNPLLKIFSGLFVTKPASQWLFEGMDLPLLDILNTKLIKDHIPLPIPYDKFGFFYKRNMSAAYDGRFTMLTGSSSLKELGMLKTWNLRNKTDFFEDYCAMVNGSSGEIFAQTEPDQEAFTLFITDVCSSLTLKFSQERNFEGLTGREFVGDATMFDNGQMLPQRSCFCEGECQPAGVRNLTRCRQGAPVFVSFPHFYLADPSYLKNLNGLSPNKSLHEFRITLDPLTGIPLDVRAQMQINLLLQPYSMFTMYKNVPRVFVPMLWFNQRAHITPDLEWQASLLIALNKLGLSISYILIALGFGMSVILMIVKYKRAQPIEGDREPIIDDVDSS